MESNEHRLNYDRAQKCVRKAGKCVNLRRLDEAEEYFKKAVEIFPSFQNVFLTARFYHDVRKFDLAKEYYDRCFEMAVSPVERAVTLISLGTLYGMQPDKFAEAKHAFMEALKIYQRLAGEGREIYKPDIAVTLNNLGNLYYSIPDYEKAEFHYKEARKILMKLDEKSPCTYIPNIAMNLYNLGNVFAHKKDYARAEVYYKRCIKRIMILAAEYPRNWNLRLGNLYVNMSMFYQEDVPNMELSIKYANEGIRVLNSCDDTQVVRDLLGLAYKVIRSWEEK